MTLPGPDPYLYQPVLQSLTWNETDDWHSLSGVFTRVGFEYEIVFTETKFDEREHVVEFKDGTTYIDGRLAHGVDGGVPGWVLSKIEVQFDGETVPVPEYLYSDCYEFLVKSFAQGSETNVEGIIVRVVDDGVLQVSRLASDGAGTYLVHWWFGGGQQAVRKVVHDEAEMHAFDDNWKSEVPTRPIARP